MNKKDLTEADIRTNLLLSNTVRCASEHFRSAFVTELTAT